MSARVSAGEALDAGIVAAGAAVRAGLPIVELVAESLARAELSAPLIAFTELFAESALRDAERLQAMLDAGNDLGALHGLPISIKDNIDVVGSVTTAGSAFLRLEPTRDATVVSRMRAAGGIAIGKNNMHEFAWGGTTDNPHTGTTRNPWDPRRSPGGSSGGSGVAVALRAVLASIGTDTGGSIRLPAALNGVTGIRPTIGRVSGAGVFPLAWSLDSTGPLATSSEDAAIVLGIIAGYDPRDPVTEALPVPDYLSHLEKPLAGLRLRWLDDYSVRAVQPAVAHAFESTLAVLAAAGAEVEPLVLPAVDELIDALMVINAAEASALHGPWIETHWDEYGPAVLELLEAGTAFSAMDYIQAQRMRAHIRDTLAGVFASGVDAILTPTLPYTLPEIGQEWFQLDGRNQDLHRSNMQFTSLASVPGLPAISVPHGFDDAGYPLGLQIVTAAFDEQMALRIGHQLQALTGYHRAIPPR